MDLKEEEERERFLSLSTHTYQRKTMGARGEKAAVLKSGRDPAPEPDLLVLHLGLLPSRTERKISFFCLSHPVYGFCYGSLSRLIQIPTASDTTLGIKLKRYSSWVQEKKSAFKAFHGLIGERNKVQCDKCSTGSKKKKKIKQDKPNTALSL